MTSSYTVNKRLEKPANGDYVNTWSTPVNADWDDIDTAFGGVTSINAVGASGTVTLTYTQYRPPNITISGTLTANVIYSLPSTVGGIWTINNGTSGAFTVTFASAGGGTSVVLPQGYRTIVVSDGTNVSLAYTFPLSAAGSNTQLQFNNSGYLGASSALTWNGTFLTSSGLRVSGSTSGTVGFIAPAIAGSTVYTLPSSDGSTGQVLTTNGSGALSWTTGASVSAGVSSFSGGTTGLTPSTATTGVVTLAGTLGTANGGTGLTSFTSGGALYATATNTLASGTLPVSAGGTGLASTPSNGFIDIGNGTGFTRAALTAGSGITITNGAGSISIAGFNPASNNTITGTQSFTGTTSNLAEILTNVAEVVTVSATAATGTVNYDVTTQSVIYYTSNASANWTVNIRGNSSTSLNSLLSVGQSITLAFLVTQGATAYYNNVIQVDGTTSGVTTKWQTAIPTAGTANAIDVYSYTVIKTANATFTVLASIVPFI